MTTNAFQLHFTFGGDKGGVRLLTISASDTFKDIRGFIREQNMIPEELLYYFCVDGMRIPVDQEETKKACDEFQKHVSVHCEKGEKRSEREEADSANLPLVKKQRVLQGKPLLEGYEVQEQALRRGKQVLQGIQSLLQQNRHFCTQPRHVAWTNKIETLFTDSKAPHTTIAMLGGTGVGKSSLLNALLGESSVLPTSGSRGCTATVVELRFREILLSSPAHQSQVSLYHGTVEFVSLQDWESELSALLNTCSVLDPNNISNIQKQEPNPRRDPEAAAAWSKLDQVYGKGTMMKQAGQQTTKVLSQISLDSRVRELLTPLDGKTHNSIVVEEGMIEPDQVADVLKSYEKLDKEHRPRRKRWASAFRSKINEFVVRKGSEHEPQTWPLIRKVILEGPWNVLSSGACLVDLPGVRDANMARAKVSEQYLVECHHIIIVAPIGRAVDDRTAQELLGDQFKRRLLMDGQYGNVSFVCSKSDECEVQEIMKENEKEARNTPKRWERMIALRDRIEKLSDSEDDADFEHSGGWDDERTGNKEQGNKDTPQRKLKRLCALVRNEFSTRQIQIQFRAGLEEMLCNNTDDEDDHDIKCGASKADVIPKDFTLAVYCVSSNDFMKIKKIKSDIDGGPSTFNEEEDTQIPALRQHVRETSASLRRSFVQCFLNNCSTVLDQVKLLAADSNGTFESQAAIRCKALVEIAIKKVEGEIRSVVETFLGSTRGEVEKKLAPSIHKGGEKGQRAALKTVESWGTKRYRTREYRDVRYNGLLWSTYSAALVREGIYSSLSAGRVNFNEELSAPIESEFMKDWVESMDLSLRSYINASEKQVLDICAALEHSITTELGIAGMEKVRLQQLGAVAIKQCKLHVSNKFTEVQNRASRMQRDLNRSLERAVRQKMASTYNAAASVYGGPGKFERMKESMRSGTNSIVSTLFSEATIGLVGSIDDMIKKLASMIKSLAELISQSFTTVYSDYCDEQINMSTIIDPVVKKKMWECREKVSEGLTRLPGLHEVFVETESLHVVPSSNDKMAGYKNGIKM